MSGTVWMFSDQIDDEDIDFMHREFVTYNMASIYYGLGMKPVIRMSHECGAIYKIGRKVLIRRSTVSAWMIFCRRKPDENYCNRKSERRHRQNDYRV